MNTTLHFVDLLLAFINSLFIKNNESPIGRFNRIMSKLESPNSGGCLFIAYVFYLNLLKYGLDTSSFKIKQYDYTYDPIIEHNLAFIQGSESNAMSSVHFTWFYEGRERDLSDTLDKYQTKMYKSHILPIKDFKLFCESALINSSWNPVFDRNKAIKLVKKELGINLNHLKV